MPTFYQNKGRVESPSKRWQTTTHSALEETAKQMDFQEQRQTAIQDMKQRKIANTKTSISFGHEKTQYISDAQENMVKCLGGSSLEERAAQAERIRAMKAGLTTTNFKLGDEHTTYLSVNRESMAIAEKVWGTGAGTTARPSLNTSLKEAVKKSSIHFGNEKPVYETVAHSGMHKGSTAGGVVDYMQRKKDIADMTHTLRKHNFSFGDEQASYETDYQRGYGSVPLEAYKAVSGRKKELRGVIEDSRACHFSLGNDTPQYVSNTHAALQVIDGHSAQDKSKDIENAKAMKAALQKTSFIIGDDANYF